MKRIGFIDYFLDEWHANNYPQWIREDSAASARELDVAYAWADSDKPDGLDTAGWCAKYGVEKLASVEELVERSDYIIVLSPDNPEHHERLSRLPLMSGKPVYIDKTFAPDLATGKRMFELARKCGTPMFSSSALRFSEELLQYPDDRVNRETLEYVAVQGPGHYDNYSVHQFEMITALMGTGASRVKGFRTENSRLLVIDYKDGRRATLHQMPQAPFRFSLQLKDGDGVFADQCTNMFPRFIHSMLDFFETGKPPVPGDETLEIAALMEAGARALSDCDKWLKVEV